MARRMFRRLAERATVLQPRFRVPRPRRIELNRSLLGDFFFVHLGIATLVAALSIGGMWWTTDRVVEENLARWAVQWVDRLDALGSPLYGVADEDEFKHIREYVTSFDEIAVVRYYQSDGTLLHEEQSGAHHINMPRLTGSDLNELSLIAEDEINYRIDTGAGEDDAYRISTSLWAESIIADGLLGFDPTRGGDEESTLLGYVELWLDFSSYRSAMNHGVMKWSLGIMLGVFFLSVIGLIGFHRALRPLYNLRAPLSSLAEGNLEIPVDDAEHAELAAINDALASTISALHQRDREIREEANFDSLTGLVGRVGLGQRLREEIDRASDFNESSAILFLDLDQFKYVNDTVGHAAGDRLLIRVADLLPMADIQFVEDGRAFNVQCSVGLAMVDADIGEPEDVLAQADLACHEAKGQGRNQFRVFTRDRGEREKIAADMGWSDRIREALDNEGFSLRYQPIIRTDDGTEYMHEVLLRMRGTGRTAIPPGAFLPAANRFGLIGDLDCWVIRTAIQKLASIRRTRPDVLFSLNLSGIGFSDPRIVDYVIEQLEVTGVPGSAIVFEVTEQVAIRYIDDANAIMRALMEVGCRFALDDFGSGFSSFNYLKQLPVSFLKIDGAFIENLANDATDRAIVTSIAQIAEALGTETIAEHVPDQETLRILNSIGIHYAQGYYIGRPATSIRKKPLLVS
jgi:EAL domain-containing protein (putative c-di-GMP-specific phosphodiesterase class I)/GGDEF domain-containing protein